MIANQLSSNSISWHHEICPKQFCWYSFILSPLYEFKTNTFFLFFAGKEQSRHSSKYSITQGGGASLLLPTIRVNDSEAS
jgi:hypothetical protein